MRKNTINIKRGFTLIELLAVILVIAIIAVITVPMVLNRVQELKRDAFRDNAIAITKAISTNKVYDENGMEVFNETTEGLEFKNKNKIEFDATYIEDQIRYTFLGDENYMIDITKCQLTNPDISLRGQYCTMEEILSLPDLIIPRGERTGSDTIVVDNTPDLNPGVMRGAGIVNDPYLIESVEDLVSFSQSVSAGNIYSGKYLRLVLSLDLKNSKSYVDQYTIALGDVNGDTVVESLKEELSKAAGFLPIGNSTNSFRGHFNGDLYTIYNLMINRPTADNVGLFGYIRNATVTSLNLNRVYIIGQNNVGGIVGYSYEGSVYESNIEGNVTGNNYVALANGYMYKYSPAANVRSVIVEGNATGNNYVGGLVGYAADNVAGTGYINGVNLGGSIVSVGVNVGRIYGGVAARYIQSSLASTSVLVNGAAVSNTDQTSNHGLDLNNLADLNDLNVAEVALDTYIGGDNDANGIYWNYEGTAVIQKKTADQPLTFTLAGAGTTISPYLITNAADLKQATLRLGSTYKLVNNINMSGLVHYQMGSYSNHFTGKFDGDLKTISNLTINSPSVSYLGFTGYLQNGTITSLNMTNLSIAGSSFVGGLVGYNYEGSVYESNVKGSVTGNNYVALANGYMYKYSPAANVRSVIVEGNATGNNYVGGLVGYAADNVASTGYITGINLGGAIVSVGANVGRIYGGSAARYIQSSLSNPTVVVNGSTVTSTSQASAHGLDLNNLADLNDLNVAEIALDTYIGGDNDANGVYWDYEGTSVVQKTIATAPLTFSLTGAGTPADPYLVTTAADLKQASMRLGSTYKLVNNIDMTGLNHYPVGSYINHFSGKFDGNLKIISNITIDSPIVSYLGFSGYLQNGIVTSLNMTNLSINGSSFVGGVVGYSYEGSIYESNIQGNITGNNYVALGTGYMYKYSPSANTRSVVVQGNVTGNNYVGGLVGYADDYVAATGYVSGVNKGGIITSVGANVGRIYGGSAARYILSSIASTNVVVNGSTVTSTNQASNHGLDFNNLADLNDLNVLEVALDTYIGGDNDANGVYWDYDGTSIVQKAIATAPLTFSLTGAGTAVSPYLISNAAELKQASLRLSSTYKLVSNIDMNGLNHYMIGSYVNRFSGKFDGDLNTISNMTINSPSVSYLGFTGYLQNGTITSLNMTNLSINGSSFVGGIVGYSYEGSIYESNIQGNITGNNYVALGTGYMYKYSPAANIRSVVVQGNVTGNNYIGGLVGYADDYIAATGYISGLNKGGSLVSVGANIGRIYGGSAARYIQSSLASTSVLVNGTMVTNTSQTSSHGQDLSNLASLNDLNVAETAFDTYIGGDNDANGIYWDYEGTSVVQKRTTTDPLTFSLTGAGTAVSPYLISNATELKQASLRLGSTYKVVSNIDMSGIVHYPIGTYMNHFTGKFDGGANTISNLTINSPAASYLGFSGYLQNGTITGLKLTNVAVNGGNFVGGLTGYSYEGNNLNSIVQGNISGNNYVALATGYVYKYTPAVNIRSIVVEGNVNGNNHVAGVVGYTADYIASTGYVNGLNKGGSITSVGTSVGRIYGTTDARYTHNSRALDSVLINGATVTGTATDRNGLNITLGDLSLDATYTSIGFNFTDEVLDYIWYIDAGNPNFREGNL